MSYDKGVLLISECYGQVILACLNHPCRDATRHCRSFQLIIYKLGRMHGLFLNPGKSFSYRLRHSALQHKLLVIKNFSDQFIVSYEIDDKRYSCRCQRTAKPGIEKSHKDIGEYSCSLSPIPPPIIQAIIIYALRSKKCQNGRRSLCANKTAPSFSSAFVCSIGKILP